MDLQPSHHQEATSSASVSTARQQFDQPSALSTDSKTLRSSARVKAAKLKSKQKCNDKDRDSTVQHSQLSSSSAVPLTDTVVPRTTRATTLKSKRSRENIAAKGKGKTNDSPEETALRTTRRLVDIDRCFEDTRTLIWIPVAPDAELRQHLLP